MGNVFTEESMAKFEAPLQPFIRRLRLESFYKSFFLALASGMVMAGVMMLIMQLFAIRYAWLVLLIGVVATPLIVGIIAYFVIYRVSLRDVIRRIDEAGLQERVTTMKDLWNDESYIAKLQRQDTLRRIHDLKPRAIKIQLPLVAGIVLFALSFTTAVSAIIPPRQTHVKVDDPIADNFKIINPAVSSVVDKLYEAVENLPETLPPTILDDIKDKLDDIIKDIEDLNNQIQNGDNVTNGDIIGGFEDVKDQLDNILQENVKGPLISDYMIQYPNLKPLANALITGDSTQVHNALYAWCRTFGSFLSELREEVKTANADEVLKRNLLDKIDELNQTVLNTSDSYRSDRDKINALVNELKENQKGLIFKDGCLLEALGNVEESELDEEARGFFAALSQALIAGDDKAAEAAVVSLENYVSPEGTVDNARLESVATHLSNAQLAATDKPSGATLDGPWGAISGWCSDLEYYATYGNLNLTSIFHAARVDLSVVAADNKISVDLVQNTITSLTNIASGKALSLYLWNVDGNSPFYDEAQENGGIAGDLRQVLDEDCKFSIYTPAPLVTALYELLDGLETTAKRAAMNDASLDALVLLRGTVTEKDLQESSTPHQEHVVVPGGPFLPIACNDISSALVGEKELEDILGDVKDDVQGSIDDLLGKEEEEEDGEEPDTGIDSRPPQDPNGPGSSTDSEQQPDGPSDPNQNPSGGTGGKDDLNGMTFFNPATNKEELLTPEKLEEFKNSIVSGNYSDEQKTQMDRYYQYLMQKFTENN